jgi:hypothetical protein
MMIENIIIFEDMLSYIEVPSFHLFLYSCDIACELPTLDEWITFWVTLEIREYREKAIPTKYTHNIILGREHKLRKSRITLTTRSSTELIIDTTCLMFFCTDNKKTAERIFLHTCCSFEFYYSCKCTNSLIDLDIGTTSCHIRRYCDSTVLTSNTDDICLACILLSIEDLMRDPFFFEEIREILTLRD